MAWEYSEKTKKLFLDAVAGKPGTHLGEIENPDGVGEHGSISCGDALKFTFRVEKNANDPLQDKIVEARYLTFGCTSAIAASEALCCILEDKRCTPIEALKITNNDIVAFLEGLPKQKIHCSVMGEEALQAAVADWAKKRNVDLAALHIDIIEEKEAEEHDRIVCKCFALTESYIKRKIRELNLRTIPEITAAIKACGACGSCQNQPGGLQDLLDEVWGTEEALEARKNSETGAANLTLPMFGAGTGAGTAAAATAKNLSAGQSGNDPIADGELSPYQFAKKVEAAIETTIRPMLQQDHGDIEIIDIKGNKVYVTLHGACAGCEGAAQTLKFLVENALRSNVSDKIKVIQV